MKYLIILSLLVTSIWGQGTKLYNKLTPEEERDGYELLFDGKSLNKFKTYRSNFPPENWKVCPGLPECAKEMEGGPGSHIEVVSKGSMHHLITKKSDFFNFDLKLEWASHPIGNSGIFIRYLESQGAWAGNSGPETQIGGPDNRDQAYPHRVPGACYDMFPLIEKHKKYAKNAWQWNEFRIIVFEDRVAHYGNNLKLLEYRLNLDDPDFERAFKKSKYRNIPMYHDLHPGSIYFQHHGELHIMYRNLRVKELKKNPWGFDSPHKCKTCPKVALVDTLRLDENLFPKLSPGCCNDPAYKEYVPNCANPVASACVTKNPVGVNPVRLFKKAVTVLSRGIQVSWEGAHEIRVLSAGGAEVFSQSSTGSNSYIIPGLQPGLYFIRIFNGKNSIFGRVLFL